MTGTLASLQEGRSERASCEGAQRNVGTSGAAGRSQRCHGMRRATVPVGVLRIASSLGASCMANFARRARQRACHRARPRSQRRDYRTCRADIAPSPAYGVARCSSCAPWTRTERARMADGCGHPLWLHLVCCGPLLAALRRCQGAHLARRPRGILVHEVLNLRLPLPRVACSKSAGSPASQSAATRTVLTHTT